MSKKETIKENPFMVGEDWKDWTSNDDKELTFVRWTFTGMLAFYGIVVLLYITYLMCGGKPIRFIESGAHPVLIGFISVGVDRYLRK